MEEDALNLVVLVLYDVSYMRDGKPCSCLWFCFVFFCMCGMKMLQCRRLPRYGVPLKLGRHHTRQSWLC